MHLAALALTLVATASGPAVSDGHRWVAAPSADGTETVLDTFTGRAQRIGPLLDCGEAGVVLGSGLLLRQCASDPISGRLADDQATILGVTTGERAQPVGLGAIGPLESDGSTAVTGVGRVGLAVHRYAYHSGDDVYLDWHTGSATREPDIRHVVDLDAPGLSSPLCAPMHRTRNIDGTLLTAMAGEDRYNAFSYDPPYGLTQRGVGRDSFGDYAAAETVLERCGHRPQVLSRFRLDEDGGSFSLAGGVLARSDASGLSVRRLATGRTRRWAASRGTPTLVRDKVFLSVAPGVGQPAWRIYAAAIR